MIEKGLRRVQAERSSSESGVAFLGEVVVAEMRWEFGNTAGSARETGASCFGEGVRSKRCQANEGIRVRDPEPKAKSSPLAMASITSRVDQRHLIASSATVTGRSERKSSSQASRSRPSIYPVRATSSAGRSGALSPSIAGRADLRPSIRAARCNTSTE